MTDDYFFDTDCLSAFLWVNGESILEKLYPHRIILPSQVYDELNRVPFLVNRVNIMLANDTANIGSMIADTDEYMDYVKMISSPDDGHKIIGRGEAAGIAMVKARGGILASNNLRDISDYVEEFNIAHITTGDILVEAYDQDVITEDEGNQLWTEMISKRRMLPTDTFSEYLKYKKDDV